MIQFKLNGKKIQVPSSWDDITFNQFLRTFDITKDNMIMMSISICTGMDFDFLLKNDISGLDELIECTKFMWSYPAEYTKKPSQIGKYKIPLDSKGEFNPQLKRLDQFEDMRKIMIDSDKGIKLVTEAYASYCAIYLQKIRDNEYTFSKAMAMVDEVKEMPAKEVIPAGSFFLIKLLNLSTGTPKTSPNTSQKPKKLKRVSKNSKKSSARMRR